MKQRPRHAALLATRVGAVELANPVLTASGTFGSGKEYADFVDLGALGGVVTKSVTLRPRLGNPPPRVVETAAGMLNAIGLQNEGVHAFLDELLPPLRARARRVIVNIAGRDEQEYLRLARILDRREVDALEVNVSCPNVKHGGMAFGVCPDTVERLVRKLRGKTRLPLWVKLSPNVTDITVVARAAMRGGAHALTVANTFLGMAVDIERRKPVLGNVTGGLSGPAVHPLVLRLVWQVSRAVELPVLAVGGVKGVREIVAYLLAGASAVQVGTMNFVEPGITMRLLRELGQWLAARRTCVRDLVGALQVP